jgi:hypothetical protein
MEVCMKKPVPAESGSARIHKKIKETGDWRGKALSQIRGLIKQADPEVVEELKWKKPSNPAGIPVWYHDGIICTGETYANHLRLTFARGASLEDPRGLFNAGLKGNVWRAIVIHEGDEVDATAFRDLIQAAVAVNLKGLTALKGQGKLKREPKPPAKRSKGAD